MAYMPSRFRSATQPTEDQRRREADQRRGSARQRGYTSAWDKAAKGHLTRHPLCVYCEMDAWGAGARVSPASLVDHLIPHRGDSALFWNRSDWVACCTECHTGPKQAAERRPLALAALVTAVRRWRATPGG
jgi:5-methylcytosine-specific restriction endonuclease McrA